MSCATPGARGVALELHHVERRGRADLADELRPHVARVLVLLVLVEEVDELPEAVLARGGSGGAGGDDRVGADEVEVAEDHPQLPAAHVALHQRRERLGGVLAAGRALEVGELGERERGVRVAEREALLRDSGRAAPPSPGRPSRAPRCVGAGAGVADADRDPDEHRGDDRGGADEPEPALAALPERLHPLPLLALRALLRAPLCSRGHLVSTPVEHGDGPLGLHKGPTRLR